jgi:hypothetical protein
MAHRALPVIVLAAHLAPGVVVEGRVPIATVAELRRRGHIVEIGEDWSEGRLTAASATAFGARPPLIPRECRATRPGGDVQSAAALDIDGARARC